MISRMPGQRPFQAFCLVAVVTLAGIPAFAQDPTSSSTLPSALPDSPSSAIAPSRPQPPIAAQAPLEPASSSVSAKTPQAPQITILEDTLIRVMTSESINSKRVKEGTPILFMVSEDVLVGDTLRFLVAQPSTGVVIKSRKAGRLTGSPELVF